jgi:hypothetical protein
MDEDDNPALGILRRYLEIREKRKNISTLPDGIPIHAIEPSRTLAKANHLREL